MNKADFNPARLRDIFDYNPETGVLVWLDGRQKGLAAGSTDARGYCQVSVGSRDDRLRTHVHQVAWAYMTGEWAPHDIDHINHDKSDNRFCNLRALSRSLNQQNQIRGHSGSLTGLLGVVPNRKTGRYMARIHVNGKSKQVGTFGTPEEAHAAYVEAKRRLHPACTL